MCRDDDVILHEQIAVRSWAFEKRHTLALDGLHVAGLRDAVFAHELDDVSVQVGQVTREAEQGLKRKKEKKKKRHEKQGKDKTMRNVKPMTL